MARFIITGEYKDKATRAARKDLKGLSKDTKEFGKIAKYYYGIATAAAGYYAKKLAKDSVNAALEDERSQRLLALTLANVASATDAAVISAEAQISKMQEMYGIADDQLRPALARLARSTGNTSTALNHLQLALDISAATGKSLEAVTAALGKAQDGNVASLQRLGLGLDANLIKSKDTDKIFKQLRRTFSGFARQEADTVEGKFRRLAVAADDAKEIIGVALIDSINDVIAAQGGVDDLVQSFNDLSYAIADTIRGFASFVSSVKTTTSDLEVSVYDLIPVLGVYLKQWRDNGRQIRINTALIKSQSAQIISARNAEYMALKKLKQGTDDTNETNKKTLEQLMAEEAARRAGFKITEDIDSIQTVAAAKRLEEARQYKMSVIDAAQAQFESIKRNYDLLSSTWEVQKSAFDVFLAYLKSKSINIPVNFIAGAMPSTSTANTMPTAGLPDPYWMSELPQYNGVYGNQSATTQINVSVNAGAIGSEEYLANVINNAILQNTRNGYSQFPAGFTT